MIPTLISFLGVEEGFRSYPYRDSTGKPTIGYGSTYYEDGRAVTMADAPITKERALEIKTFVVNQMWSKMDQVINVDLNDNQKVALISLVYNIGVEGFKTSTLLRVINQNPEDPYIRTCFEMWRYARVEGVLKPILLARRQREADLYFKKKIVSGLGSCSCSCHA